MFRDSLSVIKQTLIQGMGKHILPPKKKQLKDIIWWDM